MLWKKSCHFFAMGILKIRLVSFANFIIRPSFMLRIFLFIVRHFVSAPSKLILSFISVLVLFVLRFLNSPSNFTCLRSPSTALQNHVRWYQQLHSDPYLTAVPNQARLVLKYCRDSFSFVQPAFSSEPFPHFRRCQLNQWHCCVLILSGIELAINRWNENNRKKFELIGGLVFSKYLLFVEVELYPQWLSVSVYIRNSNFLKERDENDLREYCETCMLIHFWFLMNFCKHAASF